MLAVITNAVATAATPATAATSVDPTGIALRPRPGSSAIRTPAALGGLRPARSRSPTSRDERLAPRCSGVRAARQAGMHAASNTMAAVAAAPSASRSASRAMPGWGSASRATPSGARGDRAMATPTAITRGHDGDRDDPGNTQQEELRASHAERAQQWVIAGLERGLTGQRLGDQEQRGHAGQSREDPESLCLEVDRALELRHEVELGVDLDGLARGDPLGAAPEGGEVRVTVPQPDAGELEPLPHLVPIALVERRGRRHQHERVIGLEVGADADNAERQKRSLSRRLRVGTRIVLAGGSDSCGLSLGREPYPQRAPHPQVVVFGGAVVHPHLVGAVGVGRPAGENLGPPGRAVDAPHRHVHLCLGYGHRPSLVGTGPIREVHRPPGAAYDLREALDPVEVSLHPPNAAPSDPHVHRLCGRPPAGDRAVGSPGARSGGDHETSCDTGENGKDQPGSPARAELRMQPEPECGHVSAPPPS